MEAVSPRGPAAFSLEEAMEWVAVLGFFALMGWWMWLDYRRDREDWCDHRGRPIDPCCRKDDDEP